MRDYIILNGVNSNTITGLLISKLPPITKPKIRTQTEEIDGRDGDIVTKLGYSAYDKEIEIGLYGNFDINEVIAYFNTEGTVVFSNEADKYYNYQILDQIDYEKLIRFKTAKVKMHVQPFKYPLEETPVEINIQNVTNEAEAVDLDNTAEAPITLALKGNTSQDGTPTPEAPVEVNTVTGRQEINIVGKNIFDKDKVVLGKVWNGSNNTKRAYGYIEAVQGQQYTVSTQNNDSDLYIYAVETATVGEAGTNIRQVTVTSSNSQTFTPQTNTKYIVIQFANATNNTTQEMIDNAMVQIEKGSTATTYEPYQSQSYELDLGKNLLDINLTNIKAINTSGTWNDNVYTHNNLTVTMNEDNTFTINGTTQEQETLFLKQGVIDFQSGNYFLSGCRNGSNNTYDIRIYNYNGTGGVAQCFTGTRQVGVINNGQNYNIAIVIRANQTVNNLTFYPMVSKSDNIDFAPYKTPIEVNGMPTIEYRDYFFKDNSKWYIKRQVGKLALNGSEDWSTRSSGVGQLYELNVSSYGFYNTENQTLGFSNQYKANINLNADNTFRVLSGATLGVHNDTIGSLANYKSGLSDNNLIVYYPLKTPEDEEITDNTLIGQLNALENARSYDTTTHINQNTANKPFIINATAVQKGSDTGNVDNIGNIYAKPTIDIEGSGIVEIYLDGNQIFNVDLSTINECVIDTTNLEAYNPATTQLMNRQVTGDYSNFKINVGDNQVKVSGAVTKATISNYTRWL